MFLIIVDTGVLYAMADRDDKWHEPVKAYLKAHRDTLVVPVSVLPEICYLLNTYMGADVERRFMASLLQGEIKIEGLTPKDLQRVAELLEQYADANIGFVDATIVAIAERIKVRRILTTDRRHFSLIRPRHCSLFELLP